jgi:hypothetical protein
MSWLWKSSIVSISILSYTTARTRHAEDASRYEAGKIIGYYIVGVTPYRSEGDNGSEEHGEEPIPHHLNHPIMAAIADLIHWV